MKYIVVVLCNFILSFIVTAGSPQLINYQGKLTDAEGNPLAGSVTLSFEIYNASTGGELVWGPELHTSVSLVDGHFNIVLGSVTENIQSAFNTSDAYLQIIEGDRALLPRQRILSAPYAVRSGNGVPVGTVISSLLSPEQFAAAVGDNSSCATISENSTCLWALADNRSVSGTRYSAITGFTKAPDLLGNFLRGKGGMSGELGVVQSDSTKLPNNAFTTNSDGNHRHLNDHVTGGSAWGVDQSHAHVNGYTETGTGPPSYTESKGNHTHSVIGGGDTETRPKNVAVNYFIRIN